MVSSALIEKEDTDVGGNSTRADLRNNKSEHEADCCAGLQMEDGQLERENTGRRREGLRVGVLVSRGVKRTGKGFLQELHRWQSSPPSSFHSITLTMSWHQCH